MHGCENRKRIRRMLSLPSSSNTRGVISALDAPPPCSNSPSSFVKDVRKISVGDCALFKPPQESPPFIGIIRSLGSGKENNLQLGVTWLYRPTDIQLLKGVAVEAAPNEVFYSFHRDEIPAASLLHPCKVAFLPKGVELPSGVSSFVCRRVYDTTNKRLWWLTDKDYINGRQEEVNQLLQKTQLEMHATVQQQQGGRSPKTVSSPMSSSQLKHSPDNVQNSATAIPTQSKGKKRERNDQGSEPAKRERSSKADDADSNILRSEASLKSEIARITDKGGLVDVEAVERLVQLMQPDKPERRIDITSRSQLAGVIAVTDKVDCLNRFVQLRGLPVLDEWLQEVHKGKVGDSSSPRDHDKSVEDFLLTLLRALDRLPVNLNALQMCNIGKSVNHLRSHRNSDIQKKARSLVDTWKKRVEAEMNINDSRPGSIQGVAWQARVRNEVSHGVSRHASASDAALKNSPSQLSSSKSAPAKSIQGEFAAKSASASPSLMKLPSPPASTSASMRDGHLKTSVMSSSSELLISAAKDEKSSSSSQSHTNSQCSSDHVKNVGHVKEDARSSNSGSTSLNKSSGSASRHRKAANGLQGVAASALQRDGGSIKNSTLTRISASEMFSQPSTCEKASDVPVADSNSHKIKVKFKSSRGQNANGGSLDDPLSMNSRASSPAVPEKLGSKEKGDGYRNHTVSDMITESWQSNDLKDGVAPCDEADGSPATALDSARCQTGDDAGRSTDVAKAVSASKPELKSRKIHDSSLSSIDALIESCVKYSEANVPMSAGDVVGMNLLASVAAGEISKSSVASPAHSPQRSTSVAVESQRSKSNGDVVVNLGDTNQSKAEVAVEGQKHNTASGVSRGHKEEQGVRSRPHGKDLLSNGESCPRTEGNRDEPEAVSPVGPSTRAVGSGVSDQGHESKPAIKDDSTPNRSQGVASSLVSEDKSGVGSLKEEKQVKPVEAGSVLSACVNQKNDGKERQETKIMIKKPCSVVMAPESVGRNDKTAVSSCINNLLPGQFCDMKEDDVDLGGDRLLNQVPNQKVKPEKDGLPSLQKPEESVSDSGAFDQVTKVNDVELVNKHTPAGPSQMNSLTPAQEKEPVLELKDSKLPAREGEDAEGVRQCGENASSPAVGSSCTDGKLEFDLNEGFDVDDGKDGDLPSTATPGFLSSVGLTSQPPLSVASTSVSLPASITVAAAAKGPFVPPQDLLRNKGEIGWRGSAATSAFRPAEPRKVSELPSGVHNAHVSDGNSGKQGRARLEIDLNVADEMTMEEMDCQINDIQSTKRDGFGTNNGPTGAVSSRSAGGLDLDLNKVDEASDLGQPPPVSHRFDMPLQSIRLSSNTLSNSDSGRRDFDLNNGPAADEATVDSLSYNPHVRANLPSQPSVGFRINNTDMGTLNPWYTAASTYSAMPIPAALPDREQPFAIAGAGGVPPRMLGGPAGVMPFNPDMYRGSVLSSSPAVPFPSAPFQYPVFPFGTSFPLPSSSLPGGSNAFMDLSSGGRLCVPAVASQLVGSAPSVPSQYPRPYVVSLSDVSNSVAVDSSRKWGRQGLDLNAGPGGLDVEGRDETLPIPPRPMSNMGPMSNIGPMSNMGSLGLTDEQARLYSMAGGVMKRKEPDGGWDSDRLSYKQPSWQ